MKKTVLLPTYDFDGNILSPRTFLVLYDTHTCKDIEVSYHEYDQNPETYKHSWRYKLHDDSSITYNRSFDFHWYYKHPWPDGLIRDTNHALENNLLSPSFDNFKKLALIEANIFAILTARGHGSDNIQRAVQLISDETLSPDEKKDQKECIKQKYHTLINKYNIPWDSLVQRFFDHIPSYIWVDNKNFCKFQDIDYYQKTSIKKVLAMDSHYKRVSKMYPSIWDIADVIFAKWFSDDNIDNIISMCEYYISESKVTDDKYRLYFSGRKEDRSKVKESIKSLDDVNQVTFDETNDTIMKISV